MIDLSPPPVPDLSSEWIAIRREYLERELPARQQRRVPKRLVSVGLAAMAVAAALLVLETVGSDPPKAFAGWTASPTPPKHGQLQDALASCQENTPPVLADTRGPFSLLLFAHDGGSTPLLCISGPSLTGRAVPLPSFTQSGGPSVAPDSIAVTTNGAVLVVDPADGATYRVADGRVGANVTGVTLVLSDGSQVQATTENGWFAAWWPGTQGAQAAHVATATGASTQQLDIPSVVTAPSPQLPSQPTADNPASGSTGASAVGGPAGSTGPTGAT